MESLRDEAFRLDEAVRAALRAALGERLVAAAVWGSRATGSARADSDVNVVALAAPLPEEAEERRALVRAARRRFLWDAGLRLSLTLLTPEELALRAGSSDPLVLGLAQGHRVVEGAAAPFAEALGAVAGAYRWDEELRAWTWRAPS
ncbi:MAG: hypothetical protein IMW98_00130 [Firmicutes bacterium]|nr:hypothetical protein [Bacillota bacterium]